MVPGIPGLKWNSRISWVIRTSTAGSRTPARIGPPIREVYPGTSWTARADFLGSSLRPSPDQDLDPDLEPEICPDLDPVLDPTLDPDLDPNLDPDLGPDQDPDLDPDLIWILVRIQN